MSIFDHPDNVAPAPSWRCPHCGQLQAETSRCWRCQRAAVTCATCHRYRQAVATGLGYCAVDHVRAPLTGDEARACWEAVPAAPAGGGLFMQLDTPPTPPVARPPAPRWRHRSTKVAKPPLEEPRAAAWADRPEGRLVDAPTVEPGRWLTSEIGRRRKRRGPG